MPVVRVAVLLMAVPHGQQVNLMGAPWYVQYFFNPDYGQAGYWLKQSDRDIVLDGEVMDWVFVDDPAFPLMSREDTLRRSVRIHEKERGVDFRRFDVVAVVLGVPETVETVGGSWGVRSEHRHHHGITMRVGDTFDFVAHELGHALNLQHSFGDPKFVPEGDRPGGYAHPYCIMSAMAYGLIGAPYFPASPRDGRNEYSGLGPSLNATTALGRGWLTTHTYHLAAGVAGEFVIRSRHRGGRDPALPPQAIDVRAPDGTNYVIEFRENDGWDIGQGTPVVLLAQGRGSTGDMAYPNTHSTTYLKMLRLPATLGQDTVMYAPGFGLEVIDRSSATHTVTLRIRPGSITPASVHFDSEVKVTDSTVLETGETTFRRGEQFCVEGTWPYRKLAYTQTATIDLTYGIPKGLTAVWTVDGITISDTSGTLNIAKSKLVAHPVIPSVLKTIIEVGYEIESLPNGSRLRLTNRPEDEGFGLEVKAALYNAVGSVHRTTWVTFEGTEYRYPQEFYDLRDACIRRFRDVDRPYKVVLEPDLWKRIPLDRVQRVQGLLDALGALHDEDPPTRTTILAELVGITGDADIAPMVIPTAERLELVIPEVPPAPPAPRPAQWRQ